MSKKTFGALPPAELKEIRRRVLSDNRNAPPSASFKSSEYDRYLVKLSEKLDPATDSLTGATTADAVILKYDTGSFVDLIEADTTASSAEIIKITNRYPYFSAPADTLLVCFRFLNEWVPYPVNLSVEFVLGEVLAEVSNGLTGWTTARAFLYQRDTDFAPVYWKQEVITNIYEGISGEEGQHGVASYFNGRWVACSLSCDPATDWTAPEELSITADPGPGDA